MSFTMAASCEASKYLTRVEVTYIDKCSSLLIYFITVIKSFMVQAQGHYIELSTTVVNSIG
jgi:hypothetical protein